jgi:hypothetical protein
MEELFGRLTYDTTPAQMAQTMGVLMDLAAANDGVADGPLVGFNGFATRR